MLIMGFKIMEFSPGSRDKYSYLAFHVYSLVSCLKGGTKLKSQNCAPVNDDYAVEMSSNY